MFVFRGKLKKHDMGGGVIRQYLGECQKMNAQHWDMADGSVVKLHTHSQEQFGYVIKGGFKMLIGDREEMLKEGDAYFIPPDVPHEFTAVGQTEAIDIFSPIKTDFPWKDDK
ncbi:MAG: cupin domain-containing protein [Candidatus Omnitrophica bacterium]|nr:cupin domain-containing protein [Candidatus Omnitrophota bacterium]